MKLKKIKWHKESGHLFQNISDGLEYAFLNDDYKQIHELVLCRDYLNDVMYGSLNNKKIDIWGFKYDPQTDPAPSKKHTKLLLASKKDKFFRKKIFNSLSFVNQIERRLKMSPTEVEECENPDRHYKTGVFIFNGNKRWMKAMPMISLYTLLIRIGMVHDPYRNWTDTIQLIKNEQLEPYCKEDLPFLKKASSGMNRIIHHGDRKIFYRNIEKNYPEVDEISKIHCDFGIIGYSNNYTQPHCPHWHRYLESKQC